MPVQSWAHSQYWRFDDGVGPPPAQPSRGGYPAWQSSVIAGSLLGSLQAWYEHALWIWTWTRRLWGIPVERQRLLERIVVLTEHPAYPDAREAVTETAHVLGFNKPGAWGPLGHSLKERTDWAENTWRHLDAMKRLDAVATARGWRLTNPEKNALIELAYQSYAITPRA